MTSDLLDFWWNWFLLLFDTTSYSVLGVFDDLIDTPLMRQNWQNVLFLYIIIFIIMQDT